MAPPPPHPLYGGQFALASSGGCGLGGFWLSGAGRRMAFERQQSRALWTAATDFPLWRKRALVTWLAAQAWERVCSHFDFEAAAARLGMRMTIDGSGDELIRIQGTEQYSFSDEDGGDSGSESYEDGGEPMD